MSWRCRKLNEARLRYLRQTVAHACSRTGSPYGGPVHLNAPFRDPLAPVADAAAALFAAEISWERFFAHLAPAPAIEPVGRVPVFTASAHGLIVLGPAQPRDPASFVATVGEIARKLCWPVLADGLSPARNHAGKIPHLITTYDCDPAQSRRGRTPQAGGGPLPRGLAHQQGAAGLARGQRGPRSGSSAPGRTTGTRSTATPGSSGSRCGSSPPA